MKLLSTKSCKGKNPQLWADFSGYSADGSSPKYINMHCVLVMNQYENCLQDYYCFFNVTFPLHYDIFKSLFSMLLLSPSDEDRCLNFIYNWHPLHSLHYSLYYVTYLYNFFHRNRKNDKIHLLEPWLQSSYLYPLPKGADTTLVVRKRSKTL